MPASVRILNFDNSILRQHKLIERFNPSIIDLTDIGPRCRLYSDEKAAAEVMERISPGSENAITFLGSGDFHHITSFILDRIDDDISVISFDDHPDWDILPPKICCGSWVTRVLSKDNVKKMVIMAVSSGDISPTLFRMGNYDSLKGDRLEMYPYRHGSTKVLFKRIPKNISIDVKSGAFYDEIQWQELNKKNIPEFFLQVLRRLPTKKVYVTIDKDCLKAKDSLTNWAQGRLDIEELLSMLKLIKENTDIIGLDITGDYSPVKTKGLIRTAITAINHPRDFSAKNKPRTLIDSVNEASNIRILELLKQ